MIYARKSEKLEQSLEEHIRQCLKALEDLKNTRFWKIIGAAELELRTAIVFHDSGKIFYQKNLRKGKLSFSGHEIFSAYILKRFLWHYRKHAKTSDLELRCSWGDLSIAAVLYHHHAMGVKKRVESLRKNELRFSSQKEFEEILAEHGEILLKNLEFLESEAVKLALEMLNSDLRRFLADGRVKTADIAYESDDIIKRTWECFQKDVYFRKMMIALTTALVICDYRGVREENGGKRGFEKIVDDFIELYKIGYASSRGL
jgi:CRISPR-associated endonuclease Cas3-HD